MDKQERKEVIGELKRKEQERLLSILPMSQKFLKSYFDYLDLELSNSYNGNSLKLTEEFCNINKLEFEKVKEWAVEFGGYDDAEILWNCEDEYEFLLKDE